MTITDTGFVGATSATLDGTMRQDALALTDLHDGIAERYDVRCSANGLECCTRTPSGKEYRPGDRTPLVGRYPQRERPDRVALLAYSHDVRLAPASGRRQRGWSCRFSADNVAKVECWIGPNFW
jgi:hypothetical protein